MSWFFSKKNACVQLSPDNSQPLTNPSSNGRRIQDSICWQHGGLAVLTLQAGNQLDPHTHANFQVGPGDHLELVYLQRVGSMALCPLNAHPKFLPTQAAPTNLQKLPNAKLATLM